MYDQLIVNLESLIAKAEVIDDSSLSEILDTKLNIKMEINQLKHNSQAQGIVILNCTQNYYLLGDLHSDRATFDQFIQSINFYDRIQNNEKFQIVCLGDYVDRGKKHLELLERMIELKLKYPDYICLLRGNHDGGILQPDGSIKLPYRIPETDNPTDYFPMYLKDKIESSNDFPQVLLPLFLRWFNTLPLVAFIGHSNKVFQCVHGGLPKPILDSPENYSQLLCLSDLTKTQEIRDELMWSDPYAGEGERYLEKKRFKFTKENFTAYRDKVGIDLLFRGHEVVDNGVLKHFEGSIYTLFSTGSSPDSYYQSVNPKYLIVNEKMEIIEKDIWLVK